MYLLNGLPPILGATILHVIFINVGAIIIEFFIIKRKFNGRFLLLRVIMANLISVLAGTIVVFTVPEWIGGAVGRPDSYTYSNYDMIAMGLGLFALFISNVIIETPAYLFGQKLDRSAWSLMRTIFIANLITNIPVVIVYLWIMHSLSQY